MLRKVKSEKSKSKFPTMASSYEDFLNGDGVFESVDEDVGTGRAPVARVGRRLRGRAENVRRSHGARRRETEERHVGPEKNS